MSLNAENSNAERCSNAETCSNAVNHNYLLWSTAARILVLIRYTKMG